jgi:hypothetical protein
MVLAVSRRTLCRLGSSRYSDSAARRYSFVPQCPPVCQGQIGIPPAQPRNKMGSRGTENLLPSGEQGTEEAILVWRKIFCTP